jgi:hypothetical protein
MHPLRGKVYSLASWLYLFKNCPDCTPKKDDEEDIYIHESECGVLKGLNDICREVGVIPNEGYIKD